MTEAQRKATLKDGQQAGEMLLDIEARIGELAIKEPAEKYKGVPKNQRGLQGTVDKHERLGIPSSKRMKQSEAISKHPDIVERVKAQARENEDIPTRTAVINEIRYESQKKIDEAAKANMERMKGIVSIPGLAGKSLDKSQN